MMETSKLVTPFVQPKVEDCLLLQTGEHFPENGCPRVALTGILHCSCSHGLDSFVCEFAAQKEKLE